MFILAKLLVLRVLMIPEVNARLGPTTTLYTERRDIAIVFVSVNCRNFAGSTLGSGGFLLSHGTVGKDMSNHRLEVAPHSVSTLAGACICHRSLESRIIVLDAIQQVPHSTVFTWELVRDVLCTSNQRDIGILMLGGMAFKGIVTLPFPLDSMEERFFGLDSALPFVLASELVNNSVEGTSSILELLEGLNRSRIQRAAYYFLQFIIYSCPVVTEQWIRINVGIGTRRNFRYY
jgi:hypothetical protein